MNATKASQIVATALTLLWDGATYAGSLQKAEFGCWAITRAVEQLTELDSTKEGHAALTDPIHARITRYIAGEHHVRGYFSQVLKHYDASQEELQAFRKKMLEDILAEYVKKEALERQIEVLEQVKNLRESGEATSEYVCDNIRFQLNLRMTPEEEAICQDIKTYIGCKWSVRGWLRDQGLPSDAISCYTARIVMIDTLIARYRAELAGV